MNLSIPYEQVAQQPGESLFQLASKHLFAGFLYFCVLVVIGLAFTLSKDDRSPAAMLWIFAVMMIVMSVMGTFMQWLTDQMGRAMRSSDPQARRLKWRYGLLSLLVFPGIMALNYLGLRLYFGMEAMRPPMPAYIVAITLAFVGPLVTFLLGPISAERTQYQEKWASLDVPAE